MIAVGTSITSDSHVYVGAPYLGRIDERYIALTPICPNGTTREEIPYKEAVFIDPLTREQTSFLKLSEIAQIY